MGGCGIKKGGPDNKYETKELKYGIGVEMEHTINKALAKNIAKIHLDESPDYYRELRKMEAKLEKRAAKTRRKK